MAEPLLFTSIPECAPRRLDTRGNEIGASYQDACISSWRAAGFVPVTVNGPAEPADHGIRQLVLGRDASEITGRPHVYLDDLAAAIADDTQGPFGLLNADIAIPPSAGLASVVASIEPGRFLFARRRDTADPTHDRGVPYHGGFDFFAGHTRDLRDVRDTGFVFGLPWWDHYFPLLMLMRGCRVTQLEPQVLHLEHDERWEPSTFDSFGERFVSAITRLARGGYRSRFEAILGSQGESTGIGARLRGRSRSMRRRHLTLTRIADLNLAYLDEEAPITPAV